MRAGFIVSTVAALAVSAWAATYCPQAGDLTVAFGGGVQLYNQGWVVAGLGAAATKASYNLLGGSVDYDVNFDSVPTGVNANIYTISPSLWGGSFSQNNYCDGSKTGSDWCVEVDWVESNGNCGGQTTLHTVQGQGGGCNADGCANSYQYFGTSSYHMHISYGLDGTWTTVRNGQVIGPYQMSPVPSSSDFGTLASQYRSQGAVIYSSQWVGWVPVSQCGTSGDINNAKFSISNLVINGTVVQGPTPSGC